MGTRDTPRKYASEYVTQTQFRALLASIVSENATTRRVQSADADAAEDIIVKPTDAFSGNYLMRLQRGALSCIDASRASTFSESAVSQPERHEQRFTECRGNEKFRARKLPEKFYLAPFYILTQRITPDSRSMRCRSCVALAALPVRALFLGCQVFFCLFLFFVFVFLFLFFFAFLRAVQRDVL